MSAVMASQHTASRPVSVILKIKLPPHNRRYYIKVKIDQVAVVGRASLGIADPVRIMTDAAGGIDLDNMQIMHFTLYIIPPLRN